MTTETNKPGIWVNIGEVDDPGWPFSYRTKVGAFVNVVQKAPEAKMSEINELAKAMGLRFMMKIVPIVDETNDDVTEIIRGAATPTAGDGGASKQ